ncbi:hypothetical protein PENTCL1PPCAC_26947, partial [Pristionchus entomophagus]
TLFVASLFTFQFPISLPYLRIDMVYGSTAYQPFHPYFPPSTSGRGGDRKNSGKRERTTYSKDQLDYLENEFRNGNYPEASRKEEIALKLGLEDGKIAIWFKNRRAKARQMGIKVFQNEPFRPSNGSIPSVSTSDKSSPSSKLDSPDSTSWVKKEEGTTVSSPLSATVPSSLTAAMPINSRYNWNSPDSSMSNGLTSLPPSPSGPTVPSFPSFAPYTFPWMMHDPTTLHQSSHPVNPSDPSAASQYLPCYPYSQMFYPYHTTFSG